MPSRADIILPEIHLQWRHNGFELSLSQDWLEQNPLTQTALEAEAREWKNAGQRLTVEKTG